MEAPVNGGSNTPADSIQVDLKSKAPKLQAPGRKNDVPDQINMWISQRSLIWHHRKWQTSRLCVNVDFCTYHNVLDLKYGGLIVFLVNGIFQN